MKKALALLAAAALVLTGCSDDAGATNDFVVGTIPNPSVAAIYIGNDQGMFDDAGITVDPKPATGFAPNLAAVVNGESQVGFAAVVPLIVARSKGAPIKIIAGADAAPTTYDADSDPDNVYALPDSGITDPSDLEGKTVAVTALGSIQDLGVKIMVEKDGGDPDKVKFLNLPSNDMIAALEADRVDAVALSEPFSTAAKQKDLDPLFSYVTSPTPGAPVGAYFTSERTLSSSGEQVDKFVDALGKATAYAQDNPDAVKKIIPEYTEIKAEVAAKVTTFPYTHEITAEQIDQLSEVLIDYGYMEEPVSAEDILK